MQDRIYLLSITDFLDGEQGEALMEQAEMLVDEERKRKVQSIKQSKAKAASLGAGLLLQLAVQEMSDVENRDSAKEYNLRDNGALKEPVEQIKWVVSTGVHNKFIRLYLDELLAKIERPLPLEFSYGPSGKPYLKNYPYCFNLSHSGEYVVCVISEAEIGVDIQEHRRNMPRRLAERFFSAEEKILLENCIPEEYTKLFFGLWAKKEAYGKLTGEGITGSLELDLSQPAETVERHLGVAFQEFTVLPDYSLVVCKKI